MFINLGTFTSFAVNSIQELLWAVLHPEWRPAPPASGPKVPVGDAGSKGASEPPVPVPVKNEAPRLFALIIGINDYKKDKLKGAVADADAFQEFLEKILAVPSDHIRNLRDAQATRAGILQAFRDLQADPRIENGDAIVIFYAGHGSETKAPVNWAASGDKIQLLVPYDYHTQLNGTDVHGIPDRTLGALLTKLAIQKGDNITVIFDCCHSGSGTRTDTSNDTFLARTTEILKEVPSDLDQEIWRNPDSGERGAEIPAGFLYHGLNSHVLLAACAETETAKEDQGRGLFTQALLKEIIAAGADKLTYNDLFQRIPALPKQNPQCEGVNINRILFNSKASSPRRVFHVVEQKGNKYVMSAGAAHGITNDSEFTVYLDKESPPTAAPLGVLVVRDANVFTSDMDVPAGNSRFQLSQPAFALQTKAGTEEDLRLSIVQDNKLLDVFRRLAQDMEITGSDRRKISLVEEKEAPHMHIELENDEVVFKILDDLVYPHGLTHIPFHVSPNVEDVYPVILAAAHFQWHRRRTSRKRALWKKVRLEIREVELVEDDDGDEIPEVIGDDLNCEGVLNVVGGQEKMYGFRLVNNSDYDLYPALFYFDNSDLSITSFYQTSPKGNSIVVPPLVKQGGFFDIGYGSGGGIPRSFVLPENQDVDVGFLKLFLSTDHVDHSAIPQYSPFDKGKRGSVPVEMKKGPKWDTILVTVVIR